MVQPELTCVEIGRDQCDQHCYCGKSSRVWQPQHLGRDAAPPWPASMAHRSAESHAPPYLSNRRSGRTPRRVLEFGYSRPLGLKRLILGIGIGVEQPTLRSRNRRRILPESPRARPRRYNQQGWTDKRQRRVDEALREARIGASRRGAATANSSVNSFSCWRLRKASPPPTNRRAPHGRWLSLQACRRGTGILGVRSARRGPTCSRLDVRFLIFSLPATDGLLSFRDRVPGQ